MMNQKQQRFVEEYLVDLNATQAAIRAGYSQSSARNHAHRMMTNDDIQDAIARAQAERSERTGITADQVLEELAKIGFANMDDYVSILDDGTPRLDFSEVTRDQKAAIAEITSEVYMEGKGDDAEPVKRTKFKLLDKRAALVDIGKHLGMFVERKELTGKDGGPIEMANSLVSAVMQEIDGETRSL